jgi:FkbM family methyltransferase
MIKAFKTFALRVFIMLVKPLWGKGIGNFPPIRAIYRYLYRLLVIEQDTALTVHGSKMFVLPSSYDFLSQNLLFGEGHEKFETQIFQKLIAEGMTVVDIGANIGYYTLLAAKLVGNRGKVYAFEPEPKNYSVLVRNIEVNGYKNVVPVQKAVFSRAGKLSLHLGEYSGAHSLYNVYASSTGIIEIDAVSLDEFLEDKAPRVNIVKMDVEGAEMTVLMGMGKLIQNNPDLRIFTEFYPPGLQSSGCSAREYYDKLLASGFRYIYLINECEQKLQPADYAVIIKHFEDISSKQPTAVNLLCAKKPLEIRKTADSV